MTDRGPDEAPPARNGRLVEAAAVGAVGGVLGAVVTWPLGIGVAGGAVAAVNGAVSGWRAVYDWRSAKGVVGFVLDSTWGVVMTGAGLIANAIGSFTRDGGFIADLSERQGRHVFAKGFKRGNYVVTLGNVISRAGDTTRPRRRRLITDHEDVHVWQARWLGPLFPVIYIGWGAVGAVVGAVLWAVRQREQPLRKMVETCAYYVNPLEWWAYSRDDNWPPGGKVPDVGWRQPIVKPFPAARVR